MRDGAFVVIELGWQIDLHGLCVYSPPRKSKNDTTFTATHDLLACCSTPRL